MTSLSDVFDHVQLQACLCARAGSDMDGYDEDEHAQKHAHTYTDLVVVGSAEQLMVLVRVVILPLKVHTRLLLLYHLPATIANSSVTRIKCTNVHAHTRCSQYIGDSAPCSSCCRRGNQITASWLAANTDSSRHGAITDSSRHGAITDSSRHGAITDSSRHGANMSTMHAHMHVRCDNFDVRGAKYKAASCW